MKRRWQFSLGYALLEIFWIAVTLALAREAYWLWFRHAEFFGAWVPPDPQKGALFYAPRRPDRRLWIHGHRGLIRD